MDSKKKSSYETGKKEKDISVDFVVMILNANLMLLWCYKCYRVTTAVSLHVNCKSRSVC